MKKVNLKETSVLKVFIIYVIPSILSMVTTNTAVLIDTIFIGRYVGHEAIAALTLLFPYILLFFAIAPMIGVGGSTLAGIHKGENNDKESNNVFNVTFWLMIIVGLLISFMVIILRNQVVSMLNVSEQITEYALDYAVYVTPFLVFFILPRTLSPFIKLEEKPMQVLFSMLSGTIVNIVLDYYLIGVLGLGMKGAGLATGIGQMVTSIALIRMIAKSNYWSFKKPIFKSKQLQLLLYNGSSETLGIIAVAITGLIYNYVIVKNIGEIGISAYGVSMQVFNLITILFYGVSEAIQAPISFNYGMNEFSRVKSFRNIAIITSLGLGIIISMIIYNYNQELVQIFVEDTQTINLAKSILKFYAIGSVVVGVNIIITTYYTSINQPFISVVIAALRSVVIFLLSLFISSKIFGADGLWYPIIITEYTTLLIALYYLKFQPYGKKKYVD